MTPRIAITAGEPAGIGPDLVLTLAEAKLPAQLVILADAKLLKARAELLGKRVEVTAFDASRPRQANPPGVLEVLDIGLSVPSEPGQLDSRNGAYVLETLRAACDGCEAGEFDAMVTAPVQKSAIIEAGVAFSGHTEFLAEQTGAEQVVMLLVSRDMRVALATTHLPLADVPAAITSERLSAIITVLHRDLRSKFGIAQPRLAVLGLNPHAGESGHLGREEIDVIIPSLENLRQSGMTIDGPLPADTAFTPRVLEQCDAVLAMYHDQGLPVLKFSGFGDAVNVTLGLPIVRTSVDHGTALDIAGQGTADPGSLHRAVELAIELAVNRAGGGQVAGP